MAQYSLPFVKTPFFALNSAYDSYQQKGILQRRMPDNQPPMPSWNDSCDADLALCNATQLYTLRVYRKLYLMILE